MQPNPSIPLTLPGLIKGFRSAVAPVALDESHCSLLQNARLGDGTIKARHADVSFGTLPQSGRVAGAFECTWNGSLTWFVAISDGTYADVYVCYPGNTWYKITASSGQYGDTRIPCTSTQNVYFGIATDIGYSYTGYYNTDCVIMQNGSDSARMFAVHPEQSAPTPTFSNCITSIIILPSIPPLTNPALSNAPVTVGVGGDTWLPISTKVNNPVDVTLSSSGTHFKVDLGSTTMNYGSWKFTRDTTAGTGITATVYTDTAKDMSVFSQILITIGNTEDNTVINHLKIEATDGSGNYTTIFDPTTTQYVLVDTPGTTTGTGKQNFITIAVPQPTTAIGTSMSAMKGVKLTWTGDQPSSTLNFEIACIIGVYGYDYGGSNFGIAYYGSDYRTYGPGRILPKQSDVLTNYGCSHAFSALRYIDDERVFCRYRFIAANSGSTTPGSVSDWCMVYRNDPGVSDYYWIKRIYMYSYSGSWSAVSAFGPSFTSQGELLDYSHPIPDSYVIQTPTGTSMASCNGRLFVAANSKLWYSGYQRPFEHRQVIRYFDATTADPSSPGSLSKDGEIVQAVVPLGVIDVGQESVGSPPNSAASVHFLTDRGFYRVSGFDAISLNKSITVAPHGTKSPFSVARSRNMMYWLDDQLQVRSYSGDGGPQPLSMYRVDDYTRAVTVPSFCVGWSNRDRYYLMLTSTQILVWNEDFQEWESLDVPDSGVTNVAWGFSTVYNNLQRQMLFRTNATTNGIYEHDRPEATGNVAFAVTFRGLTAGYTATIIGRAMWVNCDGYTSGTLTTTRTTSGVVPAGTASSSISLNTTGSRTWAYDALGTGVGAYEIVPGLSGTVPSNWTLYGCGIQSEVVPVGPSR